MLQKSCFSQAVTSGAFLLMMLAGGLCHGKKLAPYRQISPGGKMRYIFSEPYHRLSNDYVPPHIP